MSAKPDDDLEALFDQIVEERAASERTHGPTGTLAMPAQEAATAAAEGDDVFQRIGHLTRTLHDALRELGYHDKLERAAGALPDAHDRLKYIAKVTGDAAERVLGRVEQGQALCATLGAQGRALDGRWQALMAGKLGVEEFKALAGETHAFVGALPQRADEVAAHFSDIMMAQDFHDLSGQVLNRVAEIVRRLETDLLGLLLATCPAEARPDEGGLSGPAIPGCGGDVVEDQQQVDALLESLGF